MVKTYQSCLLWLGLLVGVPLLALAQQASVVSLVVTDGATQRPIRNAVVTLTPKTKAPGARTLTQTTDGDGKAVFTNAPSGDYTLTITAPGYTTLTDEHYTVESGVFVEQPIELSPAGGEVVEVRGDQEAPLVAQGANAAAALTPAEIRILPSRGRDILTSFPPVPNVIRSNDGRTSIKGAREDQAAVLVNGSLSNDPATGRFQVEIPLEALQRAEVFTNPYLPEYGKFTSGVKRLETKPGGNKWTYSVYDFFPSLRARYGKIFGFANVSPRATITGPLVRDRAFLAQALEVIVDKAVVRGLASPDNEIRKHAFRSFSQFDVVLSDRQTLTVTANAARQLLRNVDLDFFNPVPASANRRTLDLAFAGVHRYAGAGGSISETRVNYKRIGVDVFGKGDAPFALTPFGRTGNFFSQTDRTTERGQLQFSTALAAFNAGGLHQIKFGADLSAACNRGWVVNRPVEVRRADGSLAERITYATRGDLRASNIEVAGYAQDQWLIRPNLQLDYGLRVETQQAAAQLNLAPRVALSYAPGGTNNTVLRAGFGLFYDKVLLNALAFRQMPQPTATTFAADGVTPTLTRSWTLDLARADGRYRVPYNRSFRVELAQRLSRRVLAKLAYLDSRTFNDFYVEPEPRGAAGVIRLFNTGRATYRALEATADVKLTPRHTFVVSYVRSKARAELNDLISYFGDTPNPIIRPNQFGNAPIDAPHRFFARGVFGLPGDWTLAPIFEWRTGFPYSVVDEAQNFVGRRNADTTRYPHFMAVDLAVTKKIRLPQWVRRGVFGRKIDVEAVNVTVNIFNLTNHFNPRNVFANTGAPQFGTFFGVYRRFFNIEMNL
ncbi:MAG: carboxypeptidase regulatory-like domain-containing protein [Chloracidobacterium sp.]|nr:carboxypeptidase regulatory-like domain-containing protein [Chloracidobacterium sp.]MDW8217998.1 carboxypeptidase regulatory-like domain-containing protein [Acidobacteriota bacterium]